MALRKSVLAYMGMRAPQEPQSRHKKQVALPSESE